MKVLIVTVAGTASRFNASFKKPILKCLYYRNSIQDSLLYNILKTSNTYDKFIIVGGYLFDELEKTVCEEFKEFGDKIELVYNPHYVDYGSIYSLHLGINAAKKFNASEISFVEGDLFVDNESYSKFINLEKNIVTINNKVIEANKAVVLYINNEDKIKYVYDTNHKWIKIDEQMKAIYNSAQIWKFINVDMLISLNEKLGASDYKGTNLILIQKYFDNFSFQDISVFEFNTWFNCNTKEDFDILFDLKYNSK